ncbi:MAG: glycerol-3-phosphate 1-O-acyltransferase PlsY [Ruminococcaceae bacterium]|nr:glycerol-3-phosphate 1-O-acyltransferase PlsY [Oscillospiraceae bacterium]
MIMTVLVTIIAAYLIGSINFAVIFAKAFMKRDVRDLGSGNAGTTNVMRNAGFLPGALTFIFDALKGFVACYLGKIIFDYVFTQTNSDWAKGIIGAFICGLACMLGHVFPLFFEFKGGKGVATSVGIFAVCCPIAIIIGLTVFAICLFTSKYVSLSSVLAAITVVVLSIIFCDKTALLFPQIVLSLAMGAIVVGKHSDNIKRLIAGTESKVKFGGK